MEKIKCYDCMEIVENAPISKCKGDNVDCLVFKKQYNKHDNRQMNSDKLNKIRTELNDLNIFDLLVIQSNIIFIIQDKVKELAK